MKLTRSFAVLVPLILTSLATAQPAATTRPATPTTKPSALEVLQAASDASATPQPASASSHVELGPEFRSIAEGIGFRPPANCKEIRRGVSEEIVQYVNDDKQWAFKVSRFTLQKPMELLDTKDTNGKVNQGLLNSTVVQLKRTIPAAEILRQDTANIGEGQSDVLANVGMIALRYSVGTQDRLTQQAIIRANELVYYVLDFTTPGAKRSKDAANDDAEDPREREAVDTFSAILDTVALYDRTAIREDQNQRLFRSRALFVSLTEEKLRSVLIPEQWFRLIQDGKDIGYTYTVEEDHKPDHTDGVHIGIRARSIPQAGIQVDAESWLFSAWDRKREDWTNVAIIARKGEDKDHMTEFGTTFFREKAVVDRNIVGNDQTSTVQEYKLDVSYLGKTSNPLPIQRDLPPYYLPQAVSHLLPRLLPLREKKTYMFAIYVGDRREVMVRYVDVEGERDVMLGGKRFAAIPIKDRIGLEGSVTTHYMSPKGEYLGSVNEDSKITILPTDAQTLQGLWKDIDLSRPEVIDPKAPVPADNKPKTDKLDK